MKRVILTLSALALLFLLPSPAQAAHSNDWYDAAEGTRWNDTILENYCLQSGFVNLLTSQQYTYMREATASRVEMYEDSTQISTNWNLLNGECDNDYNFNTLVYQFSQSYACNGLENDYPGIKSRVSYTNLTGSGQVAATLTCDFDENGHIDFFWVAIDNTYSMHWNINTTPGSNVYDFPGVWTHEFGHVTGFDAGSTHFGNSSDSCDTVTSAAYNTMCNGTGFSNANQTSWWTSLESHDIGEINQQYP